MAAENRVVVELPARYEAAKEAVRVYEGRVAQALRYVADLPESETKTAIFNALWGIDDSV